MEALTRVLGPLGYRVLEVQSDGHCLYRAVAHQVCGGGKDDVDGRRCWGSIKGGAAVGLRGWVGFGRSGAAYPLPGGGVRVYVRLWGGGGGRFIAWPSWFGVAGRLVI